MPWLASAVSAFGADFRSSDADQRRADGARSACMDASNTARHDGLSCSTWAAMQSLILLRFGM
ncbi:hypothetical protein CK489_10475 [Bradyrhizobium sp. UFLA03-84]|nr:hypothetical protein CK489_10475 [Bradyrhizobium sp. UFLA03-84]